MTAHSPMHMVSAFYNVFSRLSRCPPATKDELKEKIRNVLQTLTAKEKEFIQRRFNFEVENIPPPNKMASTHGVGKHGGADNSRDKNIDGRTYRKLQSQESLAQITDLLEFVDAYLP